MLTHAFSLWPARTSALGVGNESREASDGFGLTMAHGDVDSIDADARLLDVRPSVVTVVCFQEGLNRVGRQDGDLRRYIC